MTSHDTFIHLVAGGTGGTLGAIVTCPLEVVKTRLQSSVAIFHEVTSNKPSVSQDSSTSNQRPSTVFTTSNRFRSNSYATYSQEYCSTRNPISLWSCLRYIIKNEGTLALFKGLGPNLLGVAPTRAIYFSAYSGAKKFCNSHMSPDTHLVHIFSAAYAGFVSCTCTNPVWFIKTRLQLDQSRTDRRHFGIWRCVNDIYSKHGILGFYKGITASYFGICETVIHFVIYETIKAKFMEIRRFGLDDDESDCKNLRYFAEFMVAGATSKTIASCIAYPHEVVRTRLRQEGQKYTGFFQTLSTIYKEEGVRSLYKGLYVQLVRQIPNTAIMMSTYEAVVYLLTKYFDDEENDFYSVEISSHYDEEDDR